MSSVKVKWPFPLNTISSDWMDTKGRSSPHSGVDFGWNAGKAIRAGGPGVVHFAGLHNPDKSGYVVSIRYDGINGTVMYCHVRPNIPVKKGQRVSEGTIIAYVGATGSADGEHVHIETYLSNPTRLVNPHSLFSGVVGSGSLLASQRRVVPHAYANGRERPTTKSPVKGEMLAPGVVGNFNAWCRGEKVNGNDVWFRGISGRWFWSGGFEGGASTKGLTEVAAPGAEEPEVPSPVEPEEPEVPSPVEPSPAEPPEEPEVPEVPEEPEIPEEPEKPKVSVLTLLVQWLLRLLGLAK